MLATHRAYRLRPIKSSSIAIPARDAPATREHLPHCTATLWRETRDTIHAAHTPPRAVGIRTERERVRRGSTIDSRQRTAVANVSTCSTGEFHRSSSLLRPHLRGTMARMVHHCTMRHTADTMAPVLRLQLKGIRPLQRHSQDTGRM